MELLYDDEWVRSKEGRPLSLSLPINLDGVPLKGEKVGFYFDNLLPDSEAIRARLRARFHTATGEPFDLLEAIGRDCVGAVQLLREGDTPRAISTISATPLSAKEVEGELADAGAASRREIDGEDDFRISLAGAQEKTALLAHEGRWCRPHGSTPTTHIFKLPLGLVGGRRLDLSESLENEWLCARLLSGYGLPVAESEIKQFGDSKALVVTRFDRVLHSSKRYWLRLPQEDFCQATGTPSSMKYESDGGPGITAIARILQGSESRDDDLAAFFRAQLLFWMLAATDGHAKNFSLRLLAEGRYRLTPLYDVISAWPIVGSGQNQVHPKKLRLAMALRGAGAHYRVAEIERRHFNAMARKCGSGLEMDPIIQDVVERTPGVIDVVESRLPKGFPASLFDSIAKGLRKAANQIGRMKPE